MITHAYLYLIHIFEHDQLKMPLDTARQLNVHKAFKRHPAPLLNAFSTFNLPPLSKRIPPQIFVLRLQALT